MQQSMFTSEPSKGLLETSHSRSCSSADTCPETVVQLSNVMAHETFSRIWNILERFWTEKGPDTGATTHFPWVHLQNIPVEHAKVMQFCFNFHSACTHTKIEACYFGGSLSFLQSVTNASYMFTYHFSHCPFSSAVMLKKCDSKGDYSRSIEIHQNCKNSSFHQ